MNINKRKTNTNHFTNERECDKVKKNYYNNFILSRSFSFLPVSVTYFKMFCYQKYYKFT